LDVQQVLLTARPEVLGDEFLHLAGGEWPLRYGEHFAKLSAKEERRRQPALVSVTLIQEQPLMAAKDRQMADLANKATGTRRRAPPRQRLLPTVVGAPQT
jgi:hypothetical protein